MGMIESKVAGVTFEGRQEVMKNVKIGQVVRLEPEPENQYDSNAVAVIVESDGIGKIGYIPRDDAPDFKEMLESDKILTCSIKSVGRAGPRKPIGCIILAVTAD